MGKVFKKNQPIVAILPTGRKVEGIYIEPYGSEGHSFFVNEYNGMGPNGEPIYSKKRYGVNEKFIEPLSKKPSPSTMQYRAWLKRAGELEERIKNDTTELDKLSKDDSCNPVDKEKLTKKIMRAKGKLEELEEKIKEFEEQ